MPVQSRGREGEEEEELLRERRNAELWGREQKEESLVEKARTAVLRVRCGGGSSVRVLSVVYVHLSSGVEAYEQEGRKGCGLEASHTKINQDSAEGHCRSLS